MLQMHRRHSASNDAFALCNAPDNRHSTDTKVLQGSRAVTTSTRSMAHIAKPIVWDASLHENCCTKKLQASMTVHTSRRPNGQVAKPCIQHTSLHDNGQHTLTLPFWACSCAAASSRPPCTLSGSKLGCSLARPASSRAGPRLKGRLPPRILRVPRKLPPLSIVSISTST